MLVDPLSLVRLDFLLEEVPQGRRAAKQPLAFTVWNQGFNGCGNSDRET